MKSSSIIKEYVTQTDNNTIYVVLNHLGYTIFKKNSLTEYLGDRGGSKEQDKDS